jgi:hypothetical protein
MAREATELAMGIASALNLLIQYATLVRLLHVGLVHGPNEFRVGHRCRFIRRRFTKEKNSKLVLRMR